MEILSPTTQYATLAAILIMAATFLLYQPTGLVRWLQKKNYQYEVTFALYMLTPTEKFVFSKSLSLPSSPSPIRTGTSSLRSYPRGDSPTRGKPPPTEKSPSLTTLSSQTPSSSSPSPCSS